mmetsp:Transcript_4886/g.6813  ORF Transcript_4886/g.6813 Transcript_4886/m.6813 type:complete len:89 (+) Transcript_4886:786-1052(+)
MKRPRHIHVTILCTIVDTTIISPTWFQMGLGRTPSVAVDIIPILVRIQASAQATTRKVRAALTQRTALMTVGVPLPRSWMLLIGEHTG